MSPIENHPFDTLQVGEEECLVHVLSAADFSLLATQAATFGAGVVDPIAIVSAVETVSPDIRSTVDAAALCKMADRGQIVGGILDGPLGFDNAVPLEAARTKGIVSPVAGQADILVVPDLEAGNMLAKQLIYFAEAEVAGIVLGTRVPIMLTSRADNTIARLGSCAIALILARHRQTRGP
jgi:phosphotransacetylase